jgi:hypothetical protein
METTGRGRTAKTIAWAECLLWSETAAEDAAGALPGQGQRKPVEGVMWRRRWVQMGRVQSRNSWIDGCGMGGWSPLLGCEKVW